jgi:hypothetical protein
MTKLEHSSNTILSLYERQHKHLTMRINLCTGYIHPSHTSIRALRRESKKIPRKYKTRETRRKWDRGVLSEWK